MVVNLLGLFSKHEIFFVYDLINGIPFLPMYGRWIQIVGRTCLLGWLIKFALALSLSFGENNLINLLAKRQGYPFHDANSAILCSSFVNRQLLLQILCAWCTSALSQETFLPHGVKLETCMYCPVCVDLQ